MIDQIPDDDTRKDLFLIPEATNLYNASTGKAMHATPAAQPSLQSSNFIVASTFGQKARIGSTSSAGVTT